MPRPRKLGLAQAACKTLTALETSLGMPLLVRSVRGSGPPNSAASCCAARVVDAELRNMHEEIERFSRKHQSLIAVGLSAAAESILLSEAVARFRGHMPDAMISVLGGRSSPDTAISPRWAGP